MNVATFQVESFDVRMSRFDALPPVVREVINSASFEFHPGMAERLLRRGASASRCAERIAATDRRIAVRKGTV